MSTSKNTEQMPKKAKIMLVPIIAGISAIALIAILMFTSRGTGVENSKISLSTDEQTAYDNVAFVLTSSHKNNTTKAVKKDSIDTLHDLAKKYDNDTDWISGSDYGLYADQSFSEKERVLTISDGNNCVIFTVDRDLSKLINFNFKKEKCDGTLIYVE